jgi:hypothetical protein
VRAAGWWRRCSRRCSGGSSSTLTLTLTSPSTHTLTLTLTLALTLTLTLALALALTLTLTVTLTRWELLDSLAFTLLHPTASYSYGTTPRLLLWPPHLLLLLALAALAALLGLLPLRRLPPTAQLGCCAAFGAAAALCGSGALLPLERALFLAHAAAGGLASAFVGMALWPAQLARSGRAPAVLLGGCLALFPCGLLLQVRA